MTKLEEIFGAGMDTVEADLSIVSPGKASRRKSTACVV